MQCLVSDEDYEELSKQDWCAKKTRRSTKWHAWSSLGAMHRVIMKAPKGVEVDHIDGDSLNNQRDNLRLATGAQNRRNVGVRSDNALGIKGVGLNGSGYRARVKFEGKSFFLGRFATPELADAAVRAERERLHGEFARHL